MAPRRTRAVAAAVVAGVTLLAASTVRDAAPDGDLHPVADALGAALTERQAGRFAQASVLLLDAWVSDPARTYLLWELSSNAHLVVEKWVRDSALSVSSRLPDPWLGRCARLIFGEALAPAILDSIIELGGHDAAACGRMLQRARSLRNAPSDDASLPASPPGLRHASEWFDRTILADEYRLNPEQASAQALAVARSTTHPMRRLTRYAVAITVWHDAGRHEEAARLEQEAWALARQSGPGAELSFALEMFDTDVHRGDADLAAPVHEFAPSTIASLETLLPRLDWLAEVRLRQHLAITYQNTGQQRDAIRHYQRLAALADSVGDPIAGGSWRARIGRSLVKLGRLDEAEQAFATALSTLGNADAVMVRGDISHDLLHLLEARGRLEDAAYAGEAYVRYTDSAGTIATHMMAHHDLAWLYRRHGQLDRADAAFGRMVGIIDSIGIHHYWAGEYFESIGQLERARAYYLRALLDPRERVLILSALARVEESLGRTGEAIRFATLADADTAHWDPEHVPSLPGLLARTGREADARVRYRDVRRALRVAGKHQAFARAALESAQLELRLGHLPSAAALGDTAAAFAAILGITELEVRGIAVAAVARARAGEHRRSLAALERAVRRASAMKLTFLMADMHLLHAEALRAAGRRAAAMAAYREAARRLDEISAGLTADATQALFRATHERVSNGAISLLAANPDRANWLDEYLAWSVARKSGRPDGTRAGPVAAATIRSRLAPNEALLDFRVGDPDVSVLVITRSGARLVELPISARELASRVADFLAPIAPRVGSRIDLAHAGFDSAAARDLAGALLRPIDAELRAIERLTIVPDGVLHLLPFDALLLPDNRFVVDGFTVRYGATALANVRTRLAGGPVVAVEPPRSMTPPGAREEIDALRALFDARLTVVSDRDALPRQLRGAAIVHFATHAEANDDHPELARIAVPGPSSSGADWLYASSIGEWALDDALIVLSACESAAGPLAGGQGTLSLSRAFLRAGARGTVATLWPIGAPTAEFMTVFHAQLLAGARTEDALRTARLTLRERHPLPVHWAAFTYTVR